MEAASFVVVAAFLLFLFGYAVWPLFRVAQPAGGLSAGPDALQESEIARLLAERENAYKQIVEIDLDRQMGKLSDEDYAQMMEAARERALGILRRLEARGLHEGSVAVQVKGHEAEEAAQQVARREEQPAVSVQEGKRQSLDEKLEAEILRYRKTPPVQADAPAPGEEGAQARGAYCPFCGGAVDVGHTFCSSCGEKLP